MEIKCLLLNSDRWTLCELLSQTYSTNLLDDWPSSSAFKLSATDQAHFLTADTTIVLSRAVTTVASSIERACGCWLKVQESSLTGPSAFTSTFYLVLYQFALSFYPHQFFAQARTTHGEKQYNLTRLATF